MRAYTLRKNSRIGRDRVAGETFDLVGGAGMTVKELIEQLEKHNPEAKIQTITTGNMNEWNYTDSPKVTQSKNIFGEVVWIH